MMTIAIIMVVIAITPDLSPLRCGCYSQNSTSIVLRNTDVMMVIPPHSGRFDVAETSMVNYHLLELCGATVEDGNMPRRRSPA